MALFPSLLPRATDEKWFSLDKRLDDDAILTREEEEYNSTLQSISEKSCDLLPIGKTKDQQEVIDDEEDEEMEEDDDTGEELEDETDEYDSPRSDADSTEEPEMEMSNSSEMETSDRAPWV